MTEMKKGIVGPIGLGISLGVWVITSWRLLFHTVFRRKDRRGTEETADEEQPTRLRQQDETSGPRNRLVTKCFTRRRAFHFLIWMATTCEVLAYTIMSNIISFGERVLFAEKLGYVLLEVAGRSILEILAFSTVTALWVQTAIESAPGSLWRNTTLPFDKLPQVFLVVILALVLASTSLSVVALVILDNQDLDQIYTLPWARGQTLLEAIAWGLHCLVVIQCLVVTSKRVLLVVRSSDWTQRFSLLSKAILPMLVSSVAYASRCSWLIANFCNVHQIKHGSWSWWIGFMWTPTLLVVIALLYSARKRDQSTTLEEARQPLLPARPRPPMEAFLTFSQHRQGLEVDDSFSFCRSPITHVIAQNDGSEVADEETLSTDSEQQTR